MRDSLRVEESPTRVPLGTLLGQAFGWRSTFVFVASVASLTRLGIRLRRNGETAWHQVGAGCHALSAGGIFVLYTYLAWFTSGVAGISGTPVTFVYLAFGVFGMGSTLSAGWLVDRHDATRVAAASIGGMVIAFVALAMLAGAGLITAHASVGVYALVAAWSLVGWWFYPAQQQRPLEVAGPRGTVAISLNSSALCAGQALGGAVGGAALAAGPAKLALVAAGFEVAALTVLATTSPVFRPAARGPGRLVEE